MEYRRFHFKGTEEQRIKVEATLRELKISRMMMFLILKYFEIQDKEVLESEFPDICLIKIEEKSGKTPDLSKNGD